FTTAERMREALEGKPESRRSRRDFQRVLDAYRKVYHTAPTSHYADSSALAVGELLEEQGRILNDPKSFKDAIGQLEFLRREYPGSKFRIEALFTIAQIYRDDLDDSTQARAVYQDFLKHYPRSSDAAKARAALADMDAEAKGDKSASSSSSKPKPVKDATPVNAKADSKTAKTDKDAPSTDVVHSDRHTMPLLTKVRHWSTPDYTRVAIDLEQEVKYEAGRVPHPDRIFFDLHGAKLAPDLVGKSFEVEDGFLHRIRVAQFKPNLARVVLEVDEVAEYSAFLLPNPYRLIIDIHGKRPPAPSVTKNGTKQPQKTAGTDTAARPSNSNEASSNNPVNTQPDQRGASTVRAGSDQTKQDPKPDTKPVEIAKADSTKIEDASIDEADKATSKPTTGPTFKEVAPQETRQDTRHKKAPEQDSRAVASSGHTAAPTSSGQRSLTRALGLKIGRIVVDAGHGGHDGGTVGPDGLREKDLVLDVALKLGKLLEDRLGAEVVYTRDDDTFVPLETRTAIANKEQADLFISIHANSSRDASARGVETYYLNFTSSSDALEVAARENAVSEKSIHELQDLVKKIALKEKIQESREFAGDVQKSLYTNLSARSPGLRNRGVKKAPFIVLIGANMPSILAEISFVSNPGDEKKLKTPEYRQRIAESLYKGIAKYANGLSGVKVTSKPSRGSAVSVASK
ncbi:MAG TPA: N-acetylmuramoyl-L-alanine amidase, partial [Candidatus Angelobacter sp.]|nr:N-acetylmuramoyl-L-alanine amidase [Candidatus Angelobacter sp.]